MDHTRDTAGSENTICNFGAGILVIHRYIDELGHPDTNFHLD